MIVAFLFGWFGFAFVMLPMLWRNFRSKQFKQMIQEQTLFSGFKNSHLGVEVMNNELLTVGKTRAFKVGSTLLAIGLSIGMLTGFVWLTLKILNHYGIGT